MTQFTWSEPQETKSKTGQLLNVSLMPHKKKHCMVCALHCSDYLDAPVRMFNAYYLGIEGLHLEFDPYDT